ncbi:hypothetical protein [Mycobacterium sp. 94-17]|uniref:hypothetical protein n=1 Tax=Mycobacterium sp. 94-17 TaxID=2986147 RepID=UPI002D1E85A6|nr:hypothetical protein [Mycobacterium sp. 94-17]MEB4212317.1 hypothetical protein [Mycobacterium sp. 94-17]
MTIRRPLVMIGVAAAAAALSACVPIADKNYHGSVGDTGAPSSVSTPSVPAYPVTLSGTGEQVKTADLVAHGYTVTYQASSWTMIVSPVQADGSDGSALINAFGQDSSSGVTGTTTYRATGRTTLHISNTQGPWSLTFTPLS